ncbi:FkbM family methyltransferase [archaeon]|nr:MAG: FkbM family methyltransferase [archaeon]
MFILPSFTCLGFVFMMYFSIHIMAADAQHIENFDAEKARIYQSIVGFTSNCPGGVFLDFGSNTGVQLCRFCEPSFFPGSPLKRRFDEVFGANRTGACIMSFEPNPVHIESIHNMSEVCRKRHNIPVLQLSKVALWEMDGNMTFYLSLGQAVQEGASLFRRAKHVNSQVNNVQVHTLSVPRIFRILRHHLPKPIPIFVKMDIEGAEFEVIRALIHTGTLCYPSHYEVEYHQKRVRSADMPDYIGTFMKFLGASCNVSINPLDDETGLTMKLSEYMLKT